MPAQGLTKIKSCLRFQKCINSQYDARKSAVKQEQNTLVTFTLPGLTDFLSPLLTAIFDDC